MPKEWRIVDRGDVPDPPTQKIPFDCPHCGHTAELPVLGLPLAQNAGGVVFDTAPSESSMPAVIECRKCRKKFEMVREGTDDVRKAVR